jgi:hypothetical protein
MLCHFKEEDTNPNPEPIKGPLRLMYSTRTGGPGPLSGAVVPAFRSNGMASVDSWLLMVYKLQLFYSPSASSVSVRRTDWYL